MRALPSLDNATQPAAPSTVYECDANTFSSTSCPPLPSDGDEDEKKKWIIVGVCLGGGALLVFVIAFVCKCRGRCCKGGAGESGGRPLSAAVYDDAGEGDAGGSMYNARDYGTSRPAYQHL